ncbi:MAG: DNA polymerase III [Nitrosopumilus sp.]|nr:DNA polymerase III [Nitrosopumilus sp.]
MITMNKTNGDIAHILRKISFLLEMDTNKKNDRQTNAINFKNRAYNKAADQIENLSINIEKLYINEGIGGLLKIPSIGRAIASKIEEFIKTGEINYYNQLKSELPINVDEFLNLEGIGPKTLRLIYDSLKIKTLDELYDAATNGKIKTIDGFSQKKEEAILRKIDLYRKSKGRFLLGEIYPLVKQIEKYLSELDCVKRSVAVGSFRRMKETIGDIDFLAVSDVPQKVIESFVSMPEVKEILGKGSSKAFVKLNNGIDSDLLVVPEESYGAALQYFTGNKEHGIALRKIAQSKGLRLNEWGLFTLNSTENRIAGLTEEEIYHRLDLDWIPPEMRESKGEIELAKRELENTKKPREDRLLQLLGYRDLRGDLQVHTNNTDGKMAIEEMAYYAKEKFGLDYIAITDHTKSLKITNGLDEGQILDQANKISELNDKIKNDDLFLDKFSNEKTANIKHKKNSQRSSNASFRILSSAEVNILKDGSLDIPNNVLDKLDIVGAAIHSNFSLPIEMQTHRLITAAQNPSIDIIFHPTGRIINKRDGYPVDIPKLMESAKDTDTVLEIDAHYDRLDLKDEYIKMAVENGVRLVIDSDAHHQIHFAFLNLGVAQARRGWAKKNEILNTLPAQNLLDNLK